MHFSVTKKPESFLRNRTFINIVQLSFVFVMILAVIYLGFTAPTNPTKPDNIGINIELAFILLIAFFIASFVFLRKQKHVSEFDVDDQGITANGKIYPWSAMKTFHWYGETQDEKTGSVGVLPSSLNYDPVNAYYFADNRITRIRLKGLFSHYLSLEVEGGKSEVLANLLQQHGVNHLPRWRMVIGSPVWLALIAIFIIGCGIYVYGQYKQWTQPAGTSSAAQTTDLVY